MEIIDIVSWMGIIGIPSIFTITVWCIKVCKAYTKKMNILMKSQQAQMRSNLLKDYHRYINRGFIYEEELEDWENQYQNYHALGQNGVLDNRREQLFKLPNERKVD